MADKGLEDVPEGECLSIPMFVTARDAQVSRAVSAAPTNLNLLLTPLLPGQIESNYDETVDSFDSMNLKPELLRGVYAYGFERPSAIQQRAIMPVIKGKFAAIKIRLQ